MRVAVTGHRPEKIGGYDYYHPQREWVRRRLRESLLELKPTMTITGMALGVDQDFAQVSFELAIPFLAAIPFAGQEDQWPKSSQRYYEWLLVQADDVIVVSPGGYAWYKMHLRNHWMVENCDHLIAVWDGTDGGTAECIRYARKRKPDRVSYINPTDFFKEGL